MNKTIQLITLAVVIITAGIAWYASDQSSKDVQSVKSAVEEGDKAILDEITELNKMNKALLEKEFASFDPELEYRISSIGFEQYMPNNIHVQITNTHDDHTFVKNKWTITGDVCTINNQVRGTTYFHSIDNELDLRKGESKDIQVKIPDEFFENNLGGQAFHVMLELEMKPFTKASGPVDVSFPEKTFVQFDLNEEREGWMPWIDMLGDMNCTKSPAIGGYAFLNTTSSEHFAFYPDWKFPEN